MGVPFRITLFAPSEAGAIEAVDAAYARVAALNHIMSDYETDSEINELTRSEAGAKVEVSEDLWKVLVLSQNLATNSGGAFDITVGPCVSLWRKARREKELPEADRLERARERTGYEKLKLHPSSQSVSLERGDMRLDFGGIAKGYAADEALKILKQHGITRALVAASGDLAIGDPPPNEQGWQIDLIGSDIPGAPASFQAELSNVGVATSGDLSQRLEIGGVRYSHILNPFTCVGLTNQALTTVIARDCTTADSLATALTVLPSEAGLKLATKYKSAARVVKLEEDQITVDQNRKFEKVVLRSRRE